MVDWADGVEGRNWGIRRKTDSHNLSDLLLSIFPILLLAAVTFYYSWVRMQIVDLGYQLQRQQSQEESLLRQEKELALTEATLTNPDRIDAIARNELGMMRIQANQLITPAMPGVISDGPAILAMADATSPPAEPGKPTAAN